VGQSDSANGSEAFIWDSVSGIRGMSDLAGGDFISLAYGVSGDGTIVVGKGLSASGSEAFVWDAADGIRGLGDLDGGLFNSRAYAITGDGSFIVGQGWSALTYDAFIWSSIDGMQGLRDPDIAIIPRDAWAISNDGSTVVGEGASAGNEAFIWDKQNGLRGLGDLPDGSFASAAQAVSTDGSVVAGYGSSASGTEAFIWDNDNGMQGLGDFPGGDFYSIAYGVSGDGAIVVGAGKTYSGLEAFIWDKTNGMRRLHEVLTGLGVDLTGWTLSSARAITPDGKSIAGYGNGPNGLEAWIAHLGSAVPPPTYTVTASAGSGGSISPSGEASVSEGDSIQYAIDPASGYHIDNVLVDGVSIGDVSEYIFIDVTANHAIEATFAINKYTITATAGAGGGISPSGTGSFVHGVSPTYTITPSEGYHIADVIVDDVSVGALAEYTFAPLTAPHSIEVVFAINTYIIMSSASQGGTISPSGDVSVEHGQSPSFTITPEQGYDISDLVVDGTSVGPQSSYVFQNVTEGHTIAAAFASNQFFVELTSPNGGERWKSGSVQTITWTSAQVEFVKIDYTANNGTNWYPIVDSTPASVGSYSWNMPLSFNGDHNIYKIRISDASDPAVNDWSDATFTIFKSIITWKGGAGPFWSTVSNWDPAVVPGPYDIVIIPTGSIILSTHAAARLVNITGGNLNLNGNTLTVNGNFNLINGTLKMTAEGSVLDVNGDASFSAFDAGDNFTEGVIRVSGNFSVPVGTSFRPTGTHKVILDGSEQQTVKFELSGPSYGHFQSLEINNPAGSKAYVTVTVAVTAGIVTGGYPITIVGALVDPNGGWQVAQTIFPDNPDIPAKFYSDVTFQGNTLLSHDVEINGTVVIDFSGIVDLNGHTLVIHGELSIPSGGKLLMNSETSVLDVNGNATFGGFDVGNNLTAGVTRLSGSLSVPIGNSGFRPTGTHRVILYGSEQQTVEFELAGPGNGNFQNLEIDKTGGSVAFISDAYVSEDLMLSSSTALLISNGKTLTVSNRLITPPSSMPTITSPTPGTDRFTFIVNGGVDVDGLNFSSADANGLQLNNGVFTAFDNVNFTDAENGGRHLTIEHTSLNSLFKGLTFDNSFGTGNNVSLTDIDGCGDVAITVFDADGDGAGESFEQQSNTAVLNWSGDTD